MENSIGFNEVEHFHMGLAITDLVIGSVPSVISYCKGLTEVTITPLYGVNSFDRFETIHYRKIIIIN